MESHVDFFELKTSKDLFCKLESDLEKLESSGQDAWIAFNFFVTAEHLPDWLSLRDLVKKNCILRIVSHIANGAKHFNTRDKNHKSVTNLEKFRVFEDGVFEPDIFYEPLTIRLSPDEAKELGQSEIDALELARKVLEFWKPHIENI